MVPLTIIVTTVLIHLTWGYNEELYPLSDPENTYLYPEDFQDDDFDVHRRNSNFLRFGRSGKPRYDEYDDDNGDFARPTRGKPEKTDHFIRFGRSKQDFLRFGRDQYRTARDKNTNHLRFGRSISDSEEKSRNKRDTYPEFKRAGSNFLRFGRNSNFLRFGRNEMGATPDPEKFRQESPLVQLLTELVENIKKEQKINRV